MWILGPEKEIINLSLAERIYIVTDAPEPRIRADFYSGRSKFIYYAKSDADATYFLNKLYRQLGDSSIVGVLR